MLSTIHELRQAVRSLRRRPAFAATVVLTLALGLGTTTALFTLVRGVLLRPLPFPHPERVVRLLGYRLGEGDGYTTVSYPNFLDWRRQSRSLAAAAAYDEWQPFLLGEDGAERLAGASVNAPFFDVLAVRPAAGRFFLAAEDPPGSARAVVLSYGLWQRRFGGDRGVVGRTVALSGTDYEVVGVAPAALEDPGLSGAGFPTPEVWRVSPAYFGSGSSRDGFAFTAIARLRAGGTAEVAQGELDGIMAGLRRTYPEADSQRGMRIVPLQAEMVAPVRPVLLALLAATVLLLLVASANVASLLLTRSLARRAELALRLTLGAGRAGVLRAMMLESTLLAFAGGAVGLVLARLGVRGLLALAGSDLPRAAQVGVDGGVVLFAAAATLAVGLLVGLVPALRVADADPGLALRRDAVRQTADAPTVRLRSSMLAAEMGLSIVLLVGAGLMLRSLFALRATDPGFRPQGVLAVDVEPPYPKYRDDPVVLALWDRVLARVSALPGVVAVGAVDILPMSGDYNSIGFTVVGRPAPAAGQGPSVETRVVTPGYFAAAGIGLRRGRLLRAADRTLPVGVVDEAMARRFFPGEDPIGHRLTLRQQDWEIVGLVGNVRQLTLAEPPQPTLYLPRAEAQPFASAGGTLLLRSDRDPAALAAAASLAVRELDPDLVIADARPLARVVAASAARARLQAVLLAAFAALALVLGCVGVYGLVNGSVLARRRELAIRGALGAERRRLLRLVLGRGLLPVAVGGVAGVLAALAASRLLAGLLYGVRPADPWTFVAAPALLAAVALLAAWLPARRAASTDPVRVLREE